MSRIVVSALLWLQRFHRRDRMESQVTQTVRSNYQVEQHFLVSKSDPSCFCPMCARVQCLCFQREPTDKAYWTQRRTARWCRDRCCMGLRELDIDSEALNVRTDCVAGVSVSYKIWSPRMMESWLPSTTSAASFLRDRRAEVFSSARSLSCSTGPGFRIKFWIYVVSQRHPVLKLDTRVHFNDLLSRVSSHCRFWFVAGILTSWRQRTFVDPVGRDRELSFRLSESEGLLCWNYLKKMSTSPSPTQ